MYRSSSVQSKASASVAISTFPATVVEAVGQYCATLNGVISFVLEAPASASAWEASLLVIHVLNVDGITETIAQEPQVSVQASTSHWVAISTFHATVAEAKGVVQEAKLAQAPQMNWYKTHKSVS